MRKIKELLTVTMLLFSITSIFFCQVKAEKTLSDIQEAVNKTIQWLSSTQNSDGGWGRLVGDASDLIPTSWALVALTGNNVPSSVTGKGLQYLFQKYKSALLSGSSDNVAMGLFALLQHGYTTSNVEVDNGVKLLLTEQRDDGSWGPDFGANERTGLNLHVLSMAGQGNSLAYQKGVDFLFSRQQSDGSWGGLESPSGEVNPTALITFSLLSSGILKDDSHIQKAVSYMVSQQDSSTGSWKAPDGYRYTDLNARTLGTLFMAGIDFDSNVIQKGLAFLLTHINPDGSWRNEPDEGKVTHVAGLTAYHLKQILAPSYGQVPLWALWWFWAIIALSGTTVLLGFSTIRYHRRLQVKKRAFEPTPITKPSKTSYRVCPNCGAQLPADSMFCGKCGASLK